MPRKNQLSGADLAYFSDLLSAEQIVDQYKDSHGFHSEHGLEMWMSCNGLEHRIIDAVEYLRKQGGE